MEHSHDDYSHAFASSHGNQAQDHIGYLSNESKGWDSSQTISEQFEKLTFKMQKPTRIHRKTRKLLRIKKFKQGGNASDHIMWGILILSF